MKLFKILIAIIQIQLIQRNVQASFLNDFNTIFFENAYFRGKFNICLIILNLFYRKYFFFIKGKYLVIQFKTNECLNLPADWQNTASSVLTNKCIVLYTESDCKSSNSTAQSFSKPREGYFDISSSHPDNIPNYSFYESSYVN
jgi:hypothetical protein